MRETGSSSRAILPPPASPSGPVPGSSTDGTVVTTPPAPNAPGAPTACALSRLHATSLPRPAGTLARVNPSPISRHSPHFTPLSSAMNPPRRPGHAQTPPPPSGSSLPGPSFPPPTPPHQILTAVKPAPLLTANLLPALQAPGPPSSRESTCSCCGPCCVHLAQSQCLLK